jgi:hypothetical protein
MLFKDLTLYNSEGTERRSPHNIVSFKGHNNI